MTEHPADYITESQEALEMLGKGYNNDPIPPTEFVSTMSGFTPVPDALVKEYGYMTALVWGRIWRFCQMSDGVCRAKLEKIADMIGVSERTIIRHSQILCDGGYLFDITPELRNKPHIYADTGKIKIRFSAEATMTESHRAMTESQRQGDRESVEESTTDSVSVKRDEVNAFTLYESNIGVLTPLIADTLGDAEKEYTLDWIKDAIGLAVLNNKRNWRYCETILKRWKESGKDDGKGKPKQEKESEYETLGL